VIANIILCACFVLSAVCWRRSCCTCVHACQLQQYSAPAVGITTYTEHRHHRHHHTVVKWDSLNDYYKCKNNIARQCASLMLVKSWTQKKHQKRLYYFSAKRHNFRSPNKFRQFLHVQLQVVVLVSAFVMVSTVWSVSCSLFFYSRCPVCPAICKSGGGRTCPRALWSRRHWANLVTDTWQTV